MSDKILTAFHTTQSGIEQSILNEGFNLSIGKKHWLGKGIYFYRDIYFAIQWGFIGVVKNSIPDIETFNKNCTIISVELNCEEYNVLDMNTPDGYNIFISLKKIIEKFYSQEKCNYIYSKGDAYLIYVLELLEQKTKKKFLANYDIICAEYDYNIIYKKDRILKSDFAGCKERQICVKNPKVISNISLVNLFDENIKNIFELVKKNRGD